MKPVADAWFPMAAHPWCPWSKKKNDTTENHALDNFAVNFHHLSWWKRHMISNKPFLEASNLLLVGGFNSSEKYAGQIGSFPQISGWKITTFETTTLWPSLLNAFLLGRTVTVSPCHTCHTNWSLNFQPWNGDTTFFGGFNPFEKNIGQNGGIRVQRLKKMKAPARRYLFILTYPVILRILGFQIVPHLVGKYMVGQNFAPW